jgi:putative endonuclease
MDARGRAGEAIAAWFLALEGYEILARNARVADVELDLVARRGTLLVIVEVKTRGGDRQRASAALGAPQRRRLRRAATALLSRAPWAESLRIDAVGIDWRPGELRAEHWRGVGD